MARHYGLSIGRLKRGFAVPLGPYLRGVWREDAREWFRDLDSDFVDGTAAAALLHVESPLATDIWALATLAGWENRVRRARENAPAWTGSVRTSELMAGR